MVAFVGWLILPLAVERAPCQVAWGTNGHVLKWRQLTTHHFRVIYTAGGDTAAATVAWIAERAHAFVSRDLGVHGDFRTSLVVNTAEDVANGFASPLGHFMWVWSRGDPKTTAGPLDWLSRVVTHEFAHMATYRAERNGLGLYWEGLALGTLPMWFLEGVAQFESEPVDLHRELLLRVAALDSALLSLPRMNGFIGANRIEARLLYEQGQSLLRYLLREGGSAQLRHVLREHRSVPLNFNWTLRRVLGVSSKAAYRRWRDDLVRFYRRHWAERERLYGRERRLRLPFQGVYAVRWRPGDSTCFAAVVVRDFREEVPELVLVRPGRRDSVRVLARPYVGSHFSWSPDGRQIVYNKLHAVEGGLLTDDLFVVDVESGEEQLLTWGKRLSDPTWSPDGRWIACVQQLPDRSRLVELPADGCGPLRPLVDLGPGTAVYEPDWSPQGGTIALAYRDSAGVRAIGFYRVRDGRVTRLAGKGERRSPAFSPDGRALAFVDLGEGTPDLCVINLETGQVSRLTRVVGGLFNPSWHPDGRRLAVVDFERTDRVDAFLLNQDRRPPPAVRRSVSVPRPAWHAVHPQWWRSEDRPLPFPAAGTVPRSQVYHSFAALRPWLFLPVLTRQQQRWQLGGALGLAEPTLRQIVVVQGLLGKRADWAGSYVNSTGLLRWTVDVGSRWRDHGPWAVVSGDTVSYGERRDRLVVRGDLGFNFGRDFSANHAVAVEVGVERVVAECEQALRLLPPAIQPFRGRRVWLGAGYGYAREMPSVDSDIHPSGGFQFAVSGNWAPSALGGLPQRVFSVRLVWRWRWRQEVLALRVRGGARWGRFVLQSPPAVSAAAVRGRTSDLPGTRWLLWNAEWRQPLIDDLKLDLPYLYVEKITGALFCDGARVGGLVAGAGGIWRERRPGTAVTAGAELRVRVFPLHKVGFVLRAGWGKELTAGGQHTWFVRAGPVF